MEQENQQKVRDLYYKIKTDNDGSKYLDLKPSVQYFFNVKDKKLKEELEQARNEKQDGLFYKGFQICFRLKDDLFYFSHIHKDDDFIYKIIEILKYHNATDILIKYGELD